MSRQQPERGSSWPGGQRMGSNLRHQLGPGSNRCYHSRCCNPSCTCGTCSCGSRYFHCSSRWMNRIHSKDRNRWTDRSRSKGSSHCSGHSTSCSCGSHPSSGSMRDALRSMALSHTGRRSPSSNPAFHHCFRSCSEEHSSSWGNPCCSYRSCSSHDHCSTSCCKH